MLNTSNDIELVEMGPLSLADWVRLVGDEPSPFGASTAALEFRAKDHHVGVRNADGRLLAVAGVTVATVEVEGHDPFQVVGVGALIVRRDMRGRGLSVAVMNRTAALADSLGPARAMIFCEPHLVSLYSARRYTPVADPVTVDQPSGPVEMPMPAMWRPIRPVGWPAGPVRLRGLPF